jgi:hypothetical protein
MYIQMKVSWYEKKKEYIKQACSHKVVSPVYSYNNRHIELSSLSIHIIIDI